ncbi:hypothetical protein G4G27_13965 [Sphingomonas sp. So64.6b]|uniref:hypothetical protein n=1 Tax=Sphingomonas sp. So64.6b TaxID=2997354 RepID=UPI001601D8C7|nr:hypothetical protein [Sphingomonas sp. So64.6b]QNA84978.1 hypothetical protein G4G27_13965 [Sphingomonas sp. So64.6b]
MTTIGRRTVLQGAAGLIVAQIALGGAAVSAASPAPQPPGKPGDFDFLTGEWRIHNRMIKPGTDSEWIEFPGEATVRPILAGVCSVEELRIPARNFSGMGLRLLDVEKKIWSDHWVDGRSGVVTVPGQIGVFVDGVGTFVSEEMDGDTKVTVHGIWDRITPTSCRWYQRMSRDGGKNWKENWFMDWTRIA